MKSCRILVSLAFVLGVTAGCRSVPLPGARLFSDLVRPSQNPKEAAALFEELGGDPGFLALAHYLYRWHLDESDFKSRDVAFQGQFWMRRLPFVADEGDKSTFLEVVFPSIGVSVTLKKTDYRIHELKVDVRSDGYRVVRIARIAGEKPDSGGYACYEFDSRALYERLFDERKRAVFPSEELLARMRACVKAEIGGLNRPAGPAPEYTVYFAPVHSIANEIWAYWEEGKVLFHFTSDVDLGNPAMWTHDTLNVAIYDAVEQTVVSHEEKPGQERYLTRGQVGRALYNCMVLGKKYSVPR